MTSFSLIIDYRQIKAKEVVLSDQKLHWWQKTIAYEIYVKSFKDSNGDGIGDLKGITSELDYLKSLGVGAIWLTPCYVSPQADNGYDVADYYNIDPAYGTMADMDELISEAGKRNIRIVMDLVFNHTSSENAWFRQSRQSKDNDKSDWYIWADKPTNWRSIFGGSAWTYDEKRKQYYLHTFLSEQPDLNWKNPQVRKAVIDVANFWADKGVGGFRMDAIPYIRKPDVFEDGKPDALDGMVSVHTMTANLDGILDYLNEFKQAVREGRNIFTVGEANEVTADELPLWVGKNGVFDMVFEFSHIQIDLPDEKNWCERRAWKLPQWKKMFLQSQKKTGFQTQGWYPMFLENHDIARSVSHFLPDGAPRIQGAKALAMLLLTMRGTPFLMQGEELGYVNEAWPSIEDYDDVFSKSHYEFALSEGYSEKEAMEGVYRFSRDNARTPMQWNSGLNAGFSTKKPWMSTHSDYKDVNVESEKRDPGSVLNWYIELSKLRSTHPVLINGSYVDLLPDDEKIFAFRRENVEAKATILINLSSETALYDKALVEKAVQIAGTEGASTNGRLSPYEAVVFEDSLVEYIVLDKDEEGILRDFIYEAIFVPEGEKAPDRSILEKPEISMYYKDFGSVEADRCIVAKKGKIAIGAVWTRIMNDYGHLDDETPSLAVSLYKEYRGSGIGTVLMKKMLSLLKSQGFKKVSLSCQKANYAAIWYKTLGFQIAVDKDDEYIMVYDL